MDPIFEIKEKEQKDNYAKFEIGPLAAGYGDTIGTALRRVLISSLKGAAITSVRIQGVQHQFSTLKGMKEDVLDFLLNLKRVRFEYKGDEKATVSLSVKRPGEVKAADLVVPANVRVANPDLVLANLADGSSLNAEMSVATGVGYIMADELEREGVGAIPLDARFSPVERVIIKVEETRVGRVTNYNKLILEIWADGTIAPKDALTEAAKILLSYFEQIVNPKKVEEAAPTTEEDSLGPIGKLSIEEIGLPTRVANALAKSGFDTVEKLASAERSELTKVRNLGEKSIDVINEALKTKGVQLRDA
ncbi:DNA-directed RNA polymerase subunit alpha [Candidatus Woesebacteria bacterium RIFCSPHIGHO2_01_FULL_44_21]|uniref:DNA-directed RNA polymerase subunit alpha n=1 Tax=Candidatus Woesebacteria bacterium RIFCSPHIGHO2_01_FULL_44_21 TaxID=1802503 RepID=A0A1F7Z1D3_9BACT|nr:MAG: DNA-directed RNA polymerase subunit alpha [Candidatus Woesebacteria bacterium RIFCSPHIGHO2_01_FULL_44_21]OGM71464.1 MAG: DNA-directed RNA polymerase subunit alpha [Candidatus Woesebacteria bacterium RIFCSPLOWO2_01_FULL_44_24b]